MATVTQDPTVSSWTPVNMWAMLRALINNNVPILTINGIQFPITNGVNGTFVGQAGKGTLLIDFANAVLYQNTGTIASPTWTTLTQGGVGGAGGIFQTLPYFTTALAANGAISPHSSATFIITKPGALFSTISAPTPGGPGVGDDGVNIIIASSTPYQHIISGPGLLQTGTQFVNSAVFPQYAGGEVDLLAFNGKWIVLNSQNINFQ